MKGNLLNDKSNGLREMPKCECYVSKSTLHALSDEEVVKALKNVRQSIKHNGLVMNYDIASDNRDSAAVLDMVIYKQYVNDQIYTRRIVFC